MSDVEPDENVALVLIGLIRAGRKIGSGF